MKKSVVNLAVVGLFAGVALVQAAEMPTYKFSGALGFGLTRSAGDVESTKNVDEGEPSFGITDGKLNVTAISQAGEGVKVTASADLIFEGLARGSSVIVKDRFLQVDTGFGSIKYVTVYQTSPAFIADLSGASLSTDLDTTSGGGIAGYTSGVSSGLFYTTPELMPGLTATVTALHGGGDATSTSTEAQTPGNSSNSGYSLAVNYFQGPVGVTLSFANMNSDFNKADSKVKAPSALTVGGSYDLQAVKLAVAYYQEMTKAYDGAKEVDTVFSKNPTFVFGASAPFGDHSLGTTVSMRGKALGYQVGYNWKLGKTTTFNLSYGDLGKNYAIVDGKEVESGAAAVKQARAKVVQAF